MGQGAQRITDSVEAAVLRARGQSILRRACADALLWTAIVLVVPAL